jgi:cytochrome d ubiquinol oxidase subunit I
MAKRSIVIASVFGFISVMALIFTGHGSAVQVAKYQPMKLAAMEGLYEGGQEAELIGIAILNPKKTVDNDEDPYLFKIGFKGALSFLIDFDTKTYVPGINDLVYGDKENGILSAEERIEKGKTAMEALVAYKELKKAGKDDEAKVQYDILMANFEHFGYSYIKDPKDIVPHVPTVFYSFHIMVIFGTMFVLIFLVFGWFTIKNKIEQFKFAKLLYIIGIISIPMAFIASEAGWVVAEVGRQPWVIQDLMTVDAGVTNISSGAVQTTFWIFAFIFTGLLIAEISIMLKFIKDGPAKPENEGGK